METKTLEVIIDTVEFHKIAQVGDIDVWANGQRNRISEKSFLRRPDGTIEIKLKTVREE